MESSTNVSHPRHRLHHSHQHGTSPVAPASSSFCPLSLTPPRPYIAPPTLDSIIFSSPQAASSSSSSCPSPFSPSSASSATSTTATTPTHPLFSCGISCTHAGISPTSSTSRGNAAHSPSDAPVPSMLDLMAQFEASTTLRDSNEEPKPAWRATWEDQDNAFETEFDSELSFLCDRIHVQEEEDSMMKVGNMPYIL